MASPPSNPVAVVSRAGADRLRHGLPWVFRKDLREPPAGPAPLVDVVDERRNPVARALWAPMGAVALRRWGAPGTPLDDDQLRSRLAQALALRSALAPGADACRLVHGEADDLPGLFVDAYGEGLVVQTACSAMEGLLPRVVALLQPLRPSRLVVRRDDGSARDMEALPRVAEVLAGGPQTRVRFHEGSVTLEADLLRGHKTGAYLDQRENHALAGTLARGRCLDLFSAEGGFALPLARGADHVIAVDQDPASAAQLEANAALNGVSGKINARAANAFDAVRELDEAGQRFDVVVVDPPALAKRAGAVDSALRGYFELNRRAFRLCAPGAWMLTFSCSGRVTADVLEDVVHKAAVQSRRRAQVVQRRFAGPDHPGLLGLPETEYLKGLLLRVM